MSCPAPTKEVLDAMALVLGMLMVLSLIFLVAAANGLFNDDDDETEE